MMTLDELTVTPEEFIQMEQETNNYVLLTNDEYNNYKETYFKSGYYFGCFYGGLFCFCCIILIKMIKNTFSKIKRLKTKKNEKEKQQQSMLQD